MNSHLYSLNCINDSVTVPGAAPDNVTALSPSPHSISVEWKPLEQAEWNGILRGYLIQYSIVDSQVNSQQLTSLLPPNTTSYLLQNLQASTIYHIQVAAVTIDPGPFSSPLLIYTSKDNSSGGNMEDMNATEGSGVDGGGSRHEIENKTSTVDDEKLDSAIVAVLSATSALLLAAVICLGAAVVAMGARNNKACKIILRRNKRFVFSRLSLRVTKMHVGNRNLVQCKEVVPQIKHALFVCNQSNQVKN